MDTLFEPFDCSARRLDGRVPGAQEIGGGLRQ